MSQDSGLRGQIAEALTEWALADAGKEQGDLTEAQRELSLANARACADAVLPIVQARLDEQAAENERLTEDLEGGAKHIIEQARENQRLTDLVSKYADRAIRNGERAESAERQSYRRWLAWQSARGGRRESRTWAHELQRNLGNILSERDRLREALGRVRDLATAARLAGCGAGWTLCPADVLAALDQAPAEEANET